jgi:hypothetical protein
MKILLDYPGTGNYHVFACTVMPGPNKADHSITREIRKKYTHVKLNCPGLAGQF